jgi:hypothetical protein
MKPLRLVTEGFKMSTQNVTLWSPNTTPSYRPQQNVIMACTERSGGWCGGVCYEFTGSGAACCSPTGNSMFARQSGYRILLDGDLRLSVHFVGGLHRVDG